MLKSILTISSITAIILLSSCGETTTPKEEKKSEEKKEICTVNYDFTRTRIGFGGFKTSDKKEVKGSFDTFKVNGTVAGESASDVFENASFVITTSSVNTNDAGRDEKLKEFFFGAMTNTNEITGTVKSINTDSSTVTLSFKMNDLEKDFVLAWKENGDTLQLQGVLDLITFEAEPAVESLNEICKDLHKGADGVSKTWPEANIYITTVLEKKCK